MEWSNAEHMLLVNMAAAGAFAREIAKAVGRTKNAVIGRANRNGVKLQRDNAGFQRA